jgi:hypothetical protein
MNLQLNDPAIPPPGEMINEAAASTYRATSPLSMTGSPTIGGIPDPHHYRTPSLGEIHQELEQEQEAQVARQPSLQVVWWFSLDTIENICEGSLIVVLRLLGDLSGSPRESGHDRMKLHSKWILTAVFRTACSK